jgi:hypothetical protein
MIDIKVQQGVPALYLRGALDMCERQQLRGGFAVTDWRAASIRSCLSQPMRTCCGP